jgi:hypothetical protein
MNPNAYSTSVMGLGATLVFAATIAAAGSAASQKFFNDDPVWVEPDTEDASGLQPLEINLMVDLTYNLIAGRADVQPVRARNLNTVDEVPDSSWFTNRAGHRRLTRADLSAGPNRTSGPAPGTWAVTSSKSDGVTPGFTVKDAAGQRWFLKFDPRGHRGMATGTEVAVTRLMWALGYNVPENQIAYLRRENLTVGPNAKFTPAGGSARAMRLADIDRLLERVDQEPDGSYRVVASRALEGKPVGRIRFHGTRPDDPNDIVPHEDRRELRAYGVFAAWLNHVDAKAINSLDTLVSTGGRSFVRHHLIDFGSSLGSGGVGPADHWAGSQYLVEPADIGRQMIGLGFTYPKWHTEAFFESPSIGRLPLDNTRFDPELWRPRVPNQAFLHARADDKFWAAQRLLALTDDLLRDAVAAGEYRDPDAEAFLVRALAERRDAIVRRYLTAINPIADPMFCDGLLTFRNAAVDAGVAPAPDGYRATWFRFDNTTGATVRLGESTTREPAVEAPAHLPTADGTFLKVELAAAGGWRWTWEEPVHAYFHRVAGEWRLVGFERMPERQ